jgi:drug/metabolite transporter (DMT)-like permease
MNLNNKSMHYLILMLLALIWGSSFILMKRGMEAFSHTQVAALRIFLAFIFLLPISFQHFKMMFGPKWLPLLISGMCGNLIPAFLYTKAETELSSAVVGTLSSLTPLFTLILGVVVFKIKVKWFNVLGVIIGFTGAVGLVMVEGKSNINGNMHFAFFVALATLMYAISVNVTKAFLQEVNSLQITAVSLMFVGPPAGLYLFFTDFSSVVINHPKAASSFLYVCILAAFGTALSVIFFNVLIKLTSAVFASMVTYVIPAFALMWGIMDGEAIMPNHFAWISFIFLGIFLVNTKSLTVLSLNNLLRRNRK